MKENEPIPIFTLMCQWLSSKTKIELEHSFTRYYKAQASDKALLRFIDRELHHKYAWLLAEDPKELASDIFLVVMREHHVRDEIRRPQVAREMLEQLIPNLRVITDNEWLATKQRKTLDDWKTRAPKSVVAARDFPHRYRDADQADEGIRHAGNLNEQLQNLRDELGEIFAASGDFEPMEERDIPATEDDEPPDEASARESEENDIDPLDDEEITAFDEPEEKGTRSSSSPPVNPAESEIRAIGKLLPRMQVTLQGYLMLCARHRIRDHIRRLKPWEQSTHVGGTVETPGTENPEGKLEPWSQLPASQTNGDKDDEPQELRRLIEEDERLKLRQQVETALSVPLNHAKQRVKEAEAALKKAKTPEQAMRRQRDLDAADKQLHEQLSTCFKSPVEAQFPVT